MKHRQALSALFKSGKTGLALAGLLAITASARADTDSDLLYFDYGATSSISQATLTLRLGGFTGAKNFQGFQVNTFALQGGGNFLDFTDAIFAGGFLSQGTVGTNPVTVTLSNSGGQLDWLTSGSAGLSVSLTDTDDGFFSLDYMELQLNTSQGTVTSLLGDKDWFGLGTEPGSNVPLPGLPQNVLPPQSATILFDDAVSGIAINTVPEPGALASLAFGVSGLLGFRLRRKRA